jgi:hypothetical protein
MQYALCITHPARKITHRRRGANPFMFGAIAWIGYCLTDGRCSVLKSAERKVVSLWVRIGLWFVCLLVAVVLFTLLLSLFFNGVGFGKPWFVMPIFWVTMKCALPIWCLCLPLIAAVKQPQGRKVWTILLMGSLLGPLAIGLWFLLLQLGGAAPQPLWEGDPLLGWVGSSLAGMIFAFVVGLLTSSLYLVGFSALYRRTRRGAVPVSTPSAGI